MNLNRKAITKPITKLTKLSYRLIGEKEIEIWKR